MNCVIQKNLATKKENFQPALIMQNFQRIEPYHLAKK